MEKIEKTTATTAKYYTDLLTLLRGDNLSVIFSTEDFYNEVENLDTQYGIKPTSLDAASQRKWGVLRTFKKFFGKYLMEEISDDTWKGKGIRMLYSFEFKPADLTGMELRLMNEFPGSKRGLQKRLFEGDTETTSVEKPTSTVSSSIVKKILGKRLKQSFMKRFYGVLVLAYYNEGHISLNEISKAMSYKTKVRSSANLLKSWRSSLNRAMIFPFRASYCGSIITFDDLKSLIYKVGEKYKEWFGEDLGEKDVLKISPASVVFEKKVKEVKANSTDKVDLPIKKLLPYDIAKTIYLIAGICSNAKEVVSFENIGKKLRDDFTINIAKSDIVKLIKDNAPDYLEAIVSGSNQGILIKKSINWAEFDKEFSPRNYKSSVISRIGMSEEMLKGFISKSLEFELLSKISERDAIYRIHYDKSEHSMRDLCKLCRTFRGDDKIFDETLEKTILEINSKIDSGSFMNNPGYVLEVNVEKSKK